VLASSAISSCLDRPPTATQPVTARRRSGYENVRGIVSSNVGAIKPVKLLMSVAKSQPAMTSSTPIIRGRKLAGDEAADQHTVNSEKTPD